MTAPRVSIIVLTHNRLNLTKRLMQTVVEYTDLSEVEFIFVDNGSSDDTLEYLARLQKSLPFGIIWSNQDNTGVTPGRIQGTHLSTTDLLVFLDNDAWVTDPFWLPNLLAPFRNPKVGAVGPSGSYVERLPDERWQFIPTYEPGLTDVIQGYCIAFRKVEGITLDPAYGKFWHEESDLCMQFKAAGYDIRHLGPIGVHHTPALSGDDGTHDEKLAYFVSKWRDAGLFELERQLISTG